MWFGSVGNLIGGCVDSVLEDVSEPWKYLATEQEVKRKVDIDLRPATDDIEVRYPLTKEV